MKKWQESLFWVVCFVFVDVIFEFIKNLAENGKLNGWVFVLAALAMFVGGWMAAFAGAKSLKNKKSEKRICWMVGFVDFVIVCSVYMAFDVMQYLLEHNILNEYYFFGIGGVLIFIGWGAGRLNGMLPKPKKKRN